MTDNPKSPDGYNMDAMVQHIHDFVQTLGVGPVHLVGQSTGAARSAKIQYISAFRPKSC